MPYDDRPRPGVGIELRVKSTAWTWELMTPELAVAIADIRLLQTARLLEWMAEDHPDSETLSRALHAVRTARSLVTTLAVDG